MQPYELIKAMRAKKSLGQNFLTSHAALRKILAAGAVTHGDTILEIGPGKGFLTKALLESAKSVVAVEKDERMCEYLADNFTKEVEAGKLKLICGDILGYQPEALVPTTSNYKLIANIPYYITGAIVRRFLSARHKPMCMVLMLQDEVARRIVAQDGKESILSISVKAYGTPIYVAKVPARYFTPQPNVDSAILLIDNIKSDAFADNQEEAHFFAIVRAGFSNKRKKLINNLLPFWNDKKALLEALKQCGINESARAEELSVEKWHCITNSCRW